jgi:PBSX family phage terminase large subunit
VWYGLREYYYSGRDEKVQKTDEQYARDLDGWIMDITPGQKIRTIIDPSAASFIALLKKREHRYSVIKADNAVEDGIRELANAMDNGYLIFGNNLVNLKEEMSGYVWDDKADEDKPVKVKDHGCDACRYFVKTMHVVREATKRRLLWLSLLKMLRKQPGFPPRRFREQSIIIIPFPRKPKRASAR